jgi:hypothetical protein
MSQKKGKAKKNKTEKRPVRADDEVERPFVEDRTGDMPSYPTDTVDRPYDAEYAAEKFLRDGYIILPSAYKSPDVTQDPVNLHLDRPAKMTNLRKDLENEFLKMPEFKNHPKFSQCDEEVGYVCGGCSFLANASIYHNTISRRLRGYTTKYLVPFFRAILRRIDPENNFMVQTSCSRIMVRGKGRVVGKETWHRDVAKTSKKDEIYIGGWENLDRFNEKFVAVKKSHHLDAAFGLGSKGFLKTPREERPKMDAMLLAQANHADTDEAGNIVIPPRHFILFFQNLAHAVYSKKGPTSVKHFLGYRITPYPTTGKYNPSVVIPKKSKKAKCQPPEYTFAEIEEKLRSNDIMPMSSGQTPAMYPGKYHAYHKKHMGKFKRFEFNRLQPGVMKYPDELQKENDDRTRSMKSLKECGLPLYPPYSQDELDLINPNKILRIFNPDIGVTETFPLHDDELDPRPPGRSRSMPALLDPYGAGPSDLSLYRNPDALNEDVQFVHTDDPDALTDEDMQFVHTNAEGELVYEPDRKHSRRQSDSDSPRPRKTRGKRKVQSSSESE